MSQSDAVRQANDLRYSLHAILTEDMDCVGVVSLGACHDVIVHLQRDMDRLYAVHQTLVHPSKHVAYAAFWIRKIKPVSMAYPATKVSSALQGGPAVNDADEIVDINERICLYYTLRLLVAYVVHDQIPTPNGMSTAVFVDRIQAAFDRYVNDEEPGPALSDQFESLVYDMRFRTFGPHHVVHVVSYLLREAAGHGNN